LGPGVCGISASIPCAGENRHPWLFSPSGFCEAKTWGVYSRRHPCRPGGAGNRHPWRFSPSGFCEAKTWGIYSRRHPCRPAIAGAAPDKPQGKRIDMKTRQSFTMKKKTAICTEEHGVYGITYYYFTQAIQCQVSNVLYSIFFKEIYHPPHQMVHNVSAVYNILVRVVPGTIFAHPALYQFLIQGIL
jgi:hypothetical protein